MNPHPKIICVLPAYNEEGKIGRVVRKVISTGVVDQVVVIDDCSTDATKAEATAAGAQVICHKLNSGVGAGIRTGLNYGRKNNYEIAVIMSGDDQHEPKELPTILAPLLEGKADFVQGSRRLKNGQAVNPPLFREIATRLFSLAFTLAAGTRITDGSNGFRAFFLSLLDDDGINLDQDWLNRYELEPYLLYKAVRTPDCRVVELPITVYYRGGSRHYSKMKPFRDWWRLVRPLVFLKLRLRR